MVSESSVLLQSGVEVVFLLDALLVFYPELWFTPRDMHIRCTGDAKLPLRVSALQWRANMSRVILLYDHWDKLQHPPATLVMINWSEKG